MLLIGATDTPCEEAEPLPVADPGEGHAAAAPLRECPSAGTLAAWPCCPYVRRPSRPSARMRRDRARQPAPRRRGRLRGNGLDRRRQADYPQADCDGRPAPPAGRGTAAAT